MATTTSAPGPDRLLPASSFTSTIRSGSVRLRVGAAAGVDDHAPVSVPTLLRRMCTADGADRAAAMAVKRDGQWIRWTYKEYLDDVRSAAKAFIKFGLQDR